jgi:hypothetical protein
LPSSVAGAPKNRPGSAAAEAIKRLRREISIFNPLHRAGRAGKFSQYTSEFSLAIGNAKQPYGITATVHR